MACPGLLLLWPSSANPDVMTVSETLFSRAQKLIPGGVNSPVRAFRGVGGTPFFTTRAQGAYLTTADAEELIDYVCTWGPAIHGHNAACVREALEAAVRNGTSFGTPSPDEVTMAERLVEMVPSVDRVRMCNSGTEATMSAIRLARGFTGRDKLIKFGGCYHGHVDSLLVAAGSGALTLGHPDSAGVPASLAAETLVLDFNDTAAIDEVFGAIGEQIAAIIVEPYPANCGLILPDSGYLEHLREVCTRHGSVLIFDEVMTGFRVAPGGVQQLTGVTPDLTAMGKIIGGGLPVGAFGGRADLMAHLAPEGPVYQAGTLSGNPLAMAAGLASLNALQAGAPGLYEQLDQAGKTLAGALLEAARDKGLPLQVPQVGSMFAVFFAESPVRTYGDATSSGTKQFASLFHAALEAGVYLPPSPFETCFISTAHGPGEIDRSCDVLTQALKAL